MKIAALLAFSAGLMLAGCVSPAPQPAAIPDQVLDMAAGQTVVVLIDSGAVSVTGSAGDQLELTGELDSPAATAFAVGQTEDMIQISAGSPGRPPATSAGPAARLTLRLPHGTPLKIETFDAAVNLLDYRGSLEVSSAAGHVRAQNLSGTVRLRSGRGDVTVIGSAGDIRVLGEYGVLTLDEVQGQIGASTIMGTIRLRGEPRAEDAIHLETDHGPVEVQLGPGASVQVAVSTTSGVITCLLPGLHPEARGCSGVLGTGAAELVIRTVSGAVTLGWSQ